MVNKPPGAASKKAAAEPTPGRIKQIRMVAGLNRKTNPRALPIVALTGIGVLAIVVIISIVTGIYFLIPLGVLLGLTAAMFLFGRFAQSAQYATIAGQPGAAAAILQSMRGGWTVTPAVADLNFRLEALPQTLQMPKGPMPRPGRMPKAPRPKFR